ncbi:MAG TPA: hypothetical protein VGG22_15170 [Candidatus Baltobacteraceae bacterium]|jgi:hypothetical protein
MRAGATVDTLSFGVGAAVGVSVDSGTSVWPPEGTGVIGARLSAGVGSVVAKDGEGIGMSVALEGKPLGVGTGEADGVPAGIGLLSITPKNAAAMQTATIAAMMIPRRIPMTGTPSQSFASIDRRSPCARVLRLPTDRAPLRS